MSQPRTMSHSPGSSEPIVDAAPRSGADGRRRLPRLPRAAAFWVVAATTASLLAASSAPSPLYPVFAARFGFSALTLTAIFAVYVLTLLMSLLTVGRLSDHVGRRPVLAASLLVEIGAMALFLGADGVGWLVVARIVQGFATGAAIGVLGAYLIDLQPPDGARLGSLANSVAPTAGLGLGAIGTGALVQYAPHPTKLVFWVLLALFAVLAAATSVLPETVHRMSGAVRALRPEVAVPAPARSAFLRATPTMLATWALGGLMLSVGGSLLTATFGLHDEAGVGVVLGVFALAGAAAALTLSSLPPDRLAAAGTLTLVVGTIVFVVAVAASSLALFVVAAVVAGAGFGSAFLGALRAVTQLAEPHERAGLLSAVYIVSYVAFSVPAVVAGVLITHIGLHTTTLGYGALVLAVAAVAAALNARGARRTG
ncbi:MFS transporter [uncultured Jatrophihabitans sp.]|uniref:MFS transporter n=1 Tax=uncultured Jatrophihabitans sp. TaxID=1610747 RepID=UPI0035CC685B